MEERKEIQTDEQELVMRRLLLRELKDVTARIENGTCRMTAEECMLLFNAMGKVAMTREQSEQYLGCGNDKLHKLVKEGVLPESHHDRYMHGRVWWFCDLVKAKLHIGK